MTSRQLNVRLDPDDRDRLEALAFVRRSHASTLARAIVLEYLHRYENEPGMTDALAALKARDAADAQQGTIHRINTSWPSAGDSADSAEVEPARYPHQSPTGTSQSAAEGP